MSRETSPPRPKFEMSFGKIITLVAALGAAAIGINKMDGPDPDGCDAKRANPITWMACPLIEAGQAVNGVIFNDALSPSLESNRFDEVLVQQLKISE